MFIAAIVYFVWAWKISMIQHENKVTVADLKDAKNVAVKNLTIQDNSLLDESAISMNSNHFLADGVGEEVEHFESLEDVQLDK